MKSGNLLIADTESESTAPKTASAAGAAVWSEALGGNCGRLVACLAAEFRGNKGNS